MVEMAIELYLQEAYGAARKPSATPQNSEAARDPVSRDPVARDPVSRDKTASENDAATDPFQGFVDETLDRHARDGHWGRRESLHGRHVLERYAMRLGNRNYPFMKLILQEHIVPGEFYFTVDTHDQMDIRPDFPDYEAWMQLKRFNFRLKQEIEDSWEEAGVPTLSSVRRFAESTYVPPPSSEKRGLILVVDDEENEACMIEAVLEAQGFDVIRASDGREGLDRLRQLTALPILIVLDYEMPEMDGLTMIRELRRHEETRNLRVLLTTASEVVSSERDEADGFLPKPFHSRDFLELVDSMIGPEGPR